MYRTQVSGEYKALRYDMAKSRRSHMRKQKYKWGLVVFAAVLLSILVIFLCSSNTFGSQNYKDPEIVIVQQGECLWQIASRYAEGRDVREVVREIKSYNSLKSTDLYPGMVLQIPVAE